MIKILRHLDRMYLAITGRPSLEAQAHSLFKERCFTTLAPLLAKATASAFFLERQGSFDPFELIISSINTFSDMGCIGP